MAREDFKETMRPLPQVSSPELSRQQDETATLVNTSNSGTTNATASVVVTGLYTSVGRYIDSRSLISEDGKLQDNYFYQEYSYVLETQRSLIEFSDTLKKLLHPAGMKMFNEYDIETNLDTNAALTMASEQSVMVLVSNTAINSVAASSQTMIFTLGTGNLFITAGSPNVLAGNNTLFQANVANGQQVQVGTGLYTINTITSNTAATLITNYDSAPLSNGVWYFVSNTSA
jgi:hypothetical protein